ncbi:MAG: polysaccharide biosynthesis protein [Thermovenabulum sp.]
MLLIDSLIVNISLHMSLYLRFEGVIPKQYLLIYLKTWPVITFTSLFSYVLFNLYTRIWKFASIDELICIFLGTTFSTLLMIFYTFAFNLNYPRSIYILYWMISTILIGFTRLFLRIYGNINGAVKNGIKGKKKVLVIGAGSAGSMVIKEFKTKPELKMHPIGIIDDDTLKHGMSIYGVKVLGGRDRIEKVVNNYGVEEIIIAMPSVDRNEIRKIVDICRRTKRKIRIVPGIYELLNGNVDVKKIRDVKIEDLLGRKPVKLNLDKAKKYLENKTVLITGAGGSIGSELVRQVVNFNPKLLILFDINENNIFELENYLKMNYPEQEYIPVIGSVRDQEKVEYIMMEYKPDVVFHAAAHKHVPLMEINPSEAIKNNIFGTINLAEAADKYDVEKFILISTDKAVNPLNVMGASKRAAEIVIQMMAKRSKTCFAAVRFGNVLGSSGSVIPLFKKQIEAGGPVTVTHPEVTRYFMTIPEAVQLVIQAGSMAKGGEIFVLDMGEPVKILDLAKEMIRLSGLEPEKDIKIEFTGLRPGEKLHEELFYDKDRVLKTENEKIYIEKPCDNYLEFKKEIENLKNIFLSHDPNIKKIFNRVEQYFSYEIDEKVINLRNM